MLSLLLAVAAPPVVVVDRDNVEVTESCRVRVTVSPIVDRDGDGVIHITGDDVTVTFEGEPLRGAAAGRMPDSFEGIGVSITGERVTVTDAMISGYKVAVYAHGANGLVIEDCDVSDNFRQRLGSTARRESKTETYQFSQAQLEAYGIYELQTLESVLRQDGPGATATRNTVAERIRRKIGWAGAEAPDSEDFLDAYYRALRAHLEKRMLMGKRRENKYDT